MSSIQRDDHLKTDGPAVVATSSAVVVRAARRLPNELLLHIAGFTDRATSIRLRRVSKGFNAIIDTIRWTWLSFRTQGDYATLLANNGDKIRAQTREIHVYAFPPYNLYGTPLLASLAHSNLALERLVYRRTGLTWAPTQFLELLSPPRVDVRIGTLLTFDSNYASLDGGSLPWGNGSSIKSISFYNVGRPWTLSSGGSHTSPSRALFPALDEVVLYLVPGVTAAVFEEALSRWFAALRANRAAHWIDQKEADWGRVLGVREHVDDIV